MNNEIIFPTDTPIVTKLSDDDKLLIATADGGLASLPGSALNKVTPITSVEQIAAVRIQKLDGSQHSAAPAQMREMVGIDRSILTEQIIPGEFAVGRDGTHKQVYGRRISATSVMRAADTGARGDFDSLIPNIDTVIECSGFIRFPSRYPSGTNFYYPFGGSIYGYEERAYLLIQDNEQWGLNSPAVKVLSSTTYAVGLTATINIFLKYTKL